jgi:hypothetical protein
MNSMRMMQLEMLPMNRTSLMKMMMMTMLSDVSSNLVNSNELIL